jgi:polar amino acid transport system substrate-binding protein
MNERTRPRRIGAAASTIAALIVLLVLTSCSATAPEAAPLAASAPIVLPANAHEVTDAPATVAPDSPECLKSRRPPWSSVPSPTAARPDVAAIRDRGYLTVGVDQTTWHWGYYNAATSNYEGFDVDMLTKVAVAIFGDQALEQGKIRFKVVPNASRQKAVADGSVDLLAETMTVTCGRQEDSKDQPGVDFSSVYFMAGQGVLVPKSSGIHSLADLDGKRVCATNGSTSLDELANQQDMQGADVERWGAATQTDCLVMLQQGDVDAISTDDTILEGLAQQDPSLQVLTNADGSPVTLRAEPYGIAIAKGKTDLVQFVNAVLAQDRADGGWERSRDQWLCPGSNCTATPPDVTYKD